MLGDSCAGHVLAMCFSTGPINLLSSLAAQVGVNYDPMIAKVITHGPDRASALRAMHDALGELQVAGLPTNLEFMRRITQNDEFQQVGPCV